MIGQQQHQTRGGGGRVRGGRAGRQTDFEVKLGLDKLG
jgi:hypothetical protein